MRASELRYRRLFESARDGILILDAETGQVVDVNSFLAELLGLSRADILGMCWKPITTKPCWNMSRNNWRNVSTS
ncbi:MAG: PAS domain-containing protein [Verrucomicrobiota bacterium]